MLGGRKAKHVVGPAHSGSVRAEPPRVICGKSGVESDLAVGGWTSWTWIGRRHILGSVGRLGWIFYWIVRSIGIVMRHRGISLGVRDCCLPLRVGELAVTTPGRFFPRNGWATEAKLGQVLSLRALLDGAATAEAVGFRWTHGHHREEKDDAGCSMPQSHLAALPFVADRSETISSGRQSFIVEVRSLVRLGTLRCERGCGPVAAQQRICDSGTRSQPLDIVTVSTSIRFGGQHDGWASREVRRDDRMPRRTARNIRRAPSRRQMSAGQPGGWLLFEVCRGGRVRKCSTYAINALAITGTASTHQSP
jgi:hypothetical protein